MTKKKVYPTKYYIRFLVFVIFTIFVKYFRIKKKIPPEVKKLKSPYLLLSNHVGFWDPFVVGHLLPRFTHFVSSDAAFKSRAPGFFLPRLGTIPKKKNLRDTKVIRDMAAVIAQGENVGLFPEAVRNWAGVTLPIDPSIAKLIKFLKVPVIVASMKGMNLFNPRWSKNIRKTRVEVEYNLLFNKEQIAKLSKDEMYDMLVDAISHDEVAYQRQNRHEIRSEKRAEHISHALFVCPECHAIDCFDCSGNDFACTSCGYDIHIDRFGFFTTKSEHKLYFDNIRDWYDWQEEWLIRFMEKKYDDQTAELIFADKGSKVYFSKTGEELKFKGTADLRLFIDRIEMTFKEDDQFILLNFNDLQTINPQVDERLEIFYKGQVYRCIGGRPGVSGLKWEIAVNALWNKMGQRQKLSPYVKL